MSYRHGRLCSRRADKRITYHQVTTTPFTITLAMVRDGINIFGVNISGAATIYIPVWVLTGRVIVIKDESGNASSNNITIVVT